jgi:tetratricopeptide (TPR) repeat protein
MRLRVLVLLLLFPAIARGQDALGEAGRLLDNLDFKGALKESTRALESAQAGPGELVEAYRILGLSLSALQRADESLAAFKKLLSIDPKFQISPDISPKLSAPFYLAVGIAKELAPISLNHVPSGLRNSPTPKEVSVRLEADPQHLVGKLRICHRVGSGPWIRSNPVEVSEPGSFTLALPETVLGGEVQYYFEALTKAGGVLARAGSVAEPFGAKPKQPDKELDPGLDTSAPLAENYDEREIGKRGPEWYQSWWFWTAVGAVVVGTTVGVGVGVGMAGDDGGPRDYTVDVR